HVDALCHVIFDSQLYNGLPADTVTETGAAELSIAVAADGIVGRGVLLDVPRSRRVPWLEPGDHVTVDDLLAAERDQGVRVGPGVCGGRPLVVPVRHRAAPAAHRYRLPGQPDRDLVTDWLSPSRPTTTATSAST